jgi:Sec-independent protein translocase protein TatA
MGMRNGVLLLLLALLPHVAPFSQLPLTSTSSSFSAPALVGGGGSFTARGVVVGTRPRLPTARKQRAPRSRKGVVTMDAFSDGILGVGPQEVVVICIVGYFLLGPTELYRLAKEVGKLVTQLRQTATEASSAFSETMEQQLALSEIQSASRELQDAFSNPLSFEARQSRVMGEEAAMEAAQARAAEEASAAAAVTGAGIFAEAGAEEAEEAGAGEAAAAAAAAGEERWPGDVPPTLEAPADDFAGAAEGEAAPSLGVGFGPQASKFEQQMSGEWNEAVLRGEGPWAEADSAALAARSAAMGGTGGPLGGPLGGAGGVDSPLGTFTRARALAGNDEDLLLEIATLENDKAMALMKLDDEFEAKRRLLEETFSLKEDVLAEYATKVAGLEASMRSESAEESAAGSAEEAAEAEAEAETEAKAEAVVEDESEASSSSEPARPEGEPKWKSVRNGLSVQVYPTGEAFFANGTKVEGGFENLLAAEGEDQGAKADADVAPLGATMAALQNNANAESESDKAWFE